MKKLTLLIIATTLISFNLWAQSIKTPAASTTQTIMQDFALSSIEINYSRPSMKGRTIFGDLVPFGKPWRTGANNATKITFGEDVKISGKELKAGSYALYTIPGQSEWEVIINKGTGNWGVVGYNPTDDLVRFKIKPIDLDFTTETFTMQIGNISNTSADIMLWWDKTAIVFTVEADVDSKIMADIDKAFSVDSKPYFTAAQYYFENGKDLNKALIWASKATEQNPKAYWMFLLKARIEQKLGKNGEAKISSAKSLELAKEAGNPDYITLNEKLLKSL
ncbi:MAG: DUF2911 domain-containing protein [Bacteroidota bacterium]